MRGKKMAFREQIFGYYFCETLFLTEEAISFCNNGKGGFLPLRLRPKASIIIEQRNGKQLNTANSSQPLNSMCELFLG
jgi:hypothetical protein